MMTDDRRVRVGDVDRRQFIHTTVGGALLGVATRYGFVTPSIRRGGSESRRMSPDAAVQELIAGNRRFATNTLTSTGHDLSAERTHTAEKQEPFAAVLACADSRVPVELVFDQTIGQIFVTRVAGNIVTPEIVASLEYGVAELGVKALLVLGHTHCGAVKAAMKSESVPGQISALYTRLHAAVDRSAGDVERAVSINAAVQADLLRTSSTVIRDATRAGTLRVVSGVYDLATGKVTLAS